MNTDAPTAANAALASNDPPPVVPPPGTPAVAAPAPPAPPTAGNGAEVKLTSEALKQRLADERKAAERQLLAKYGAEKPEDLDAKLKKLAEHEAAQLTEQERTAKQIAELTKAADSAKGFSATAADAVQELFVALPPDAQAAIEELQPANPAERLKLIRAFRKVAPAVQTTTTSTGAHVAAAPIVQPPPPPAPAPANTAPAAPAPRPGGKSKYQEYEDMKAQKPAAAGLFYQANRAAIEASRPTG